MPPVELDLLRVFVTVADEASFSRAADKLGLTKGTVSRALARLEGEVGAELLHRTTRQVALSTAGTALYERTAPHLAALKNAIADLPEREQEPSGELRLTAPPDIGSIVLPEILARFTLRYPAIRVDVRLSNGLVDLVASGFDLAVRAAGELKDSTLAVRKLSTLGAGYYAAPGYVARRGEPREYGDAAHDWVVLAALSRRFPLPAGVKPRLVSDDFMFLREALRASIGVGMLPTFVGEPHVVSGDLVRVLPRTKIALGSGLVLLYPSSGTVPRKVMAFRDFLLEALKARPIA
jgi:DNA-binding transcriptional LysR family regulator